jgi:hypothetical protein
MTAPLQAIDNTIAFFTANPDAWIQGDLFGKGVEISYNRRRRKYYANAANAECFCVIGRLAVELNDTNYDEYNVVERKIGEPAGASVGEIWRVNDNAKSVDEVIDYLKTLRERHVVQ